MNLSYLVVFPHNQIVFQGYTIYFTDSVSVVSVIKTYGNYNFYNRL